MRALLSTFAALGLLAGLCGDALAQLTATGIGGGDTGGGAPAPSCTEATTWLTGKTTTWSAAYATLICGLVSDGTFSSFERIYVLATDSSTNALADLVTGASATISGTATFTANQGYLPDGSTGTLNTGFNYSTGSLYTQNSATIMAWTTLGAGADNGCPIGEASLSGDIGLQARDFGGSIGGHVNGGAGVSFSVASGSGLTALDRSSSSLVTVYKNGASVSTASSTSASPSNTTAQGFECSGGSFFSHNVAMIAVANSLGATNEASVYARFHTFLNTVNSGLYP